MNDPLSQLVATLHKVQGTMGPQLVRLAAARHLDKVRLSRLQQEAGQLRGAADALLGRMMQSEAALDLMVQTKALVTFFEKAEQHAAALLRRLGQAGSDTAADQNDEALSDVDGDQESDGPATPVHVGSGRVRSAPSPTNRGRRNAARIVKLGLSGSASAGAGAHLKRRSPI